MSASVVSFPERMVKADVDKIMPFLERAGNDPCELVNLAKMGMRALEAHQRKGDCSRRAQQGVMNAATLIFLAMGTFVGIIPPSGVQGETPEAD